MSLLIFRGQHWIEKILNEHFGFHPLHADTQILLQTGYYEQFSGLLRRITGIRALTQTIWLGLYKVSVVFLCGTGVAVASLSTVKSRGCTVGDSAAYRFIGRVPGSCPLLSCFVLFSRGRSDHTLFSSFSFHLPAFQIVCVLFSRRG